MGLLESNTPSGIEGTCPPSLHLRIGQWDEVECPPQVGIPWSQTEHQASFSIAACRCTHQDRTPPSESFLVRNQSFPADLRHQQQDHQVTLFLETGKLSPQPILAECLCSMPRKSTSHTVSTRIRHLCPTPQLPACCPTQFPP